MGTLDGPGLAGECGLVEHTVARHETVDRHDLAGLDEQEVTGDHLLDRPGGEVAVLVPGDRARGAREQ